MSFLLVSFSLLELNGLYEYVRGRLSPFYLYFLVHISLVVYISSIAKESPILLMEAQKIEVGHSSPMLLEVIPSPPLSKPSSAPEGNIFLFL